MKNKYINPAMSAYNKTHKYLRRPGKYYNVIGKISIIIQHEHR